LSVHTSRTRSVSPFGVRPVSPSTEAGMLLPLRLRLAPALWLGYEHAGGGDGSGGRDATSAARVPRAPLLRCVGGWGGGGTHTARCCCSRGAAQLHWCVQAHPEAVAAAVCWLQGGEKETAAAAAEQLRERCADDGWCGGARCVLGVGAIQRSRIHICKREQKDKVSGC
jgi:hypothetical protein